MGNWKIVNKHKISTANKILEVFVEHGLLHKGYILQMNAKRAAWLCRNRFYSLSSD